LVILNANPLKIPREDLINLFVIETISHGKTVYRHD
jgi:predicted amidohydrolase YtcJ